MGRWCETRPYYDMFVDMSLYLLRRVSQTTIYNFSLMKYPGLYFFICPIDWQNSSFRDFCQKLVGPVFYRFHRSVKCSYVYLYSLSYTVFTAFFFQDVQYYPNNKALRLHKLKRITILIISVKTVMLKGEEKLRIYYYTIDNSHITKTKNCFNFDAHSKIFDYKKYSVM